MHCRFHEGSADDVEALVFNQWCMFFLFYMIKYCILLLSVESPKKLSVILKDIHTVSEQDKDMSSSMLLRFEHIAGLTLTIQGSSFKSITTFGDLQFVNVYDEKYLVGYVMVHGKFK